MSEKEVYTTTVQSIASGGTGGEPTAVDSKDGKIVRIRPLHIDEKYTHEELADSMWELEVDGKKFRPEYKAAPNYMALAYKERVYSKNRVMKPLKRVDWEPGGDPATMNAANRGKSKFVEISWDEALDIMESEIKRVIDQYGPYSVLCIGEDGHRESKDLHAGGGMHMTAMNLLGGYTRETRTPDSVEGWYWGAKHFWGSGFNRGGGLIAPPQNGYSNYNVVKDVTENADLLVFDAGDWELTQNYASMFFSRLLKYWEELGKEFVSVDPFCNYTAVCHKTFKWIPILPNTDAALDFGAMYVMITEGIYDKEYIDTHSIGFDKVADYVLGKEDGIRKTPEWASERCGIPPHTIKAYARNLCKKRASHVHYSSGSIKTPYSHEPGRTQAYLLAMQGMGKPGVQQLHLEATLVAKEKLAESSTRPFSLLNHCRMFYPSAQSLPRTAIAEAIRNGHVEWYGSPCIVYVPTDEQFKKFTYPGDPKMGLMMAQAMAQRAGLPVPTEEPRINPVHMLWSEKPCNMNCWNGGFEFQDAIRSDEVEFFVTNHQWMENDSLFADLVLPVTTCLEDDDTMGASMTVGMRWAGYTPHACDRVGISKSDWEIALEVLDRFGKREELDLGMTTDQWLEYGFANSHLTTEVDWDTLVEKGLYYPKLEENWRDELPGMRGFYEDPENFPLDTPSGKLEFYSQALADNFPDDKERQPIAKWITGGPAEEGWTHDESLWGERCKKYPLLVTANPARFRVHVQGDDIAWYREIETTKVKGPDGYLYEPVWMAPEDAEARGIKNGDIVKVYNERGIILTGARISQRITPGSVVVAKGSRVDPIAPHIDRGGAINLISPEATVSKNCKGFAVTGYLIEAEKLTQEEYDSWKKDYPEAFNRAYDAGQGITRDAWVVEA
ncbi:molybdopterin-dependent oxidoreductase [Ellagibacter isourolithinifaciens]|uniref:molybdopterin-dependent oxidoreductase n=1 Tax=Ellagibacter isourolithinifaciens TaxID=2137581 RepID=UPI003AF002A0